MKNRTAPDHPHYTSRSASALAFLKSGSNDVDVFVEDTGNHNMWFLAIRQLLPEHVKFRSVHLLGGKDNVIKACRADQKETNRRRIYIIDGDLNFLLGKKAPRIKHLYMLKAYCFENLLISEQSVVPILLSAQPNKTPTEIIEKLSFNDWLNATTSRLIWLFAIYALAYDLDPSIKTVAFPVGELCVLTSNGHDICPKKTWKRMVAVRRALKYNCSVSAIAPRLSAIRDRVLSLDGSLLVSGKDYLIPLLYFRLSKMFGYRANFEGFKVELAKNWDYKRDADLANRIRKLVAEL